MKSQFRTATLSTVALGMLCAAPVTLAAEPAYPTKAIRIIVNSPPGAPPDVVARVVGERLGAALGQPVVVENRPGGMGTIALSAVAKANPDGYTLGTMSPPHTVAPALLSRLSYDTQRDLVAVTQMTRASLVLVVRSESSIQSVADLIATAKAHPGLLKYSSAGIAIPSHLAGELLEQRAGISCLHVPYTGGPASMTALLGGQVDFTFATGVTAVSGVHSGRLRALATTGPARDPVFPEVATFAELGFTGFDVRDWQGLVAPAGTPAPVVERIALEVRKTLEQADVRQHLARLGLDAVTDSSPAMFGDLIRSELSRWSSFVRETGIHAN